jgi:hypothetical protein
MLKNVCGGTCANSALPSSTQLQGGDTVGRTELIERLAAMGFGNPGVEVGNADPIELRGGEGQLVPLLRCTRGERPLHVHARPAAEGASHLAVDESRHADLDAAWTDVILGNQRVNERDDDRGLDAGEEPGRLYPGDRRRCQVIVHLAGLVARPGLLFGRASGKRRNRSHHADALKKFPPTHALIVRHGALQA